MAGYHREGACESIPLGKVLFLRQPHKMVFKCRAGEESKALRAIHREMTGWTYDVPYSLYRALRLTVRECSPFVPLILPLPSGRKVASQRHPCAAIQGRPALHCIAKTLTVDIEPKHSTHEG